MASPVRAWIIAGLALCAPLAGVRGAEAPPTVQAFVAPAGLKVCDGGRGYAATHGQARTFLWRPEWLALQKKSIRQDSKRAETLRRSADAALRRGPYSVRHKQTVAASGDPGDYVSTGPYWWPDPNTADGLPYVRRDGDENPERDGEKFDSTRLNRMADDVALLTLAANHLNEQLYARHAGQLVRTWFLDPSTRMNPNLDYAQAVPGRSAGRPFGVIDAIPFVEVIESIAVLKARGVLSTADDAALRRWFADLVQWMRTSENGKGASATSNNHGLYFDLMLAHFSLYSGDETLAKRLIETYPARRVLPQIEASGRMPNELARTRPWSYSVFALDAALQMAALGECVGLDLWRWRAPGGTALRAAVDYLIPYRYDLGSWPYPDKDLADARRKKKVMNGAERMFRRAAWGWRDAGLNGVHSPPVDDYLLPDYRP